LGRDLFLHHYLPAHLASALVAGSLLEFIFSVELINDGSRSKYAKKGFSFEARKHPARDKIVGRNLTLSWAAMGITLALILGGWYYFLPLTYGYPGLTPDEVNARKWLGVREIE
jgi:dolichyl-phosphate-mannose-protein mannosyltransferase